jgi:hypothetical protein
MTDRQFKTILLLALFGWIFILVLLAQGNSSVSGENKSVKSTLAKLMSK